MDFSENKLQKESFQAGPSTLYVIGTPIGNLADLSSRAKSILSTVSIIACEDTRHSGMLLKRLKIKNDLLSFHQHNTQQRIPLILKALQNGKSIGLISDAGLPGISDPGEELIKAAKNASIEVICVPGPCAATTALVTRGLPSNKFCFEGFLPTKSKERDEALLSISNEKRTTVIYESPHKLLKLLKELSEVCGNDRNIQVARELTKRYEEHIGDTIGEVIKHFEENKPRGEFTIVLGGCPKKASEYQIKNIPILINKLHSLIQDGTSTSSAVKEISKQSGVSKRLLYSLIHKNSQKGSHQGID